MSHVGSASAAFIRPESKGTRIDSTRWASPKSSAVRRARSASVMAGSARCSFAARPDCSTRAPNVSSWTPALAGTGALLTLVCEAQETRIAASVGRRARRSEDPGLINRITSRCYLSGRDVIPENAIGRIQHGECGSAHGVAVGEIAADQACAPRGALSGGDDDDVGVERANQFDAHELETESTGRERFDGFNGCFRTEPKVADGTRLSFGTSDEALAVILEL